MLTDAAIEGKNTDHLAGLKENVIIGKPIPAGTASSAIARWGSPLAKGRPRRACRARSLPDFAPWVRLIGGAAAPAAGLVARRRRLPQHGHETTVQLATAGLSLATASPQLSDEDARLYIYDDLGVSQR